ncbi:thermonuclease family protein [Candidatus Poribacteria bacterium]|nr:thermonuclease family protein [Candidatus Poribacteria bacterium]
MKYNNLRIQFSRFHHLTTPLILILFIWYPLIGCNSSKILLNEDAEPIYYGTIESIDQVYDGDTIQDVSILIYPFLHNKSDISNIPLIIWPGVERRQDGIYSLTNIRIAGIDTPEKRPRKAGRTEASLQREKDRAAAATDFLKHLILDNTKENGKLGFYIQNPEFGTYAGRIIADLFFYNNDITINIADELINSGHAVEYDGGTKTHDWGAE